jgi:hypothetical protein
MGRACAAAERGQPGSQGAYNIRLSLVIPAALDPSAGR